MIDKCLVDCCLHATFVAKHWFVESAMSYERGFRRYLIADDVFGIHYKQCNKEEQELVRMYTLNVCGRKDDEGE